MRRSVVITVTGPDRPGIVERVAAAVVRAGGNWEESRMTRLAGYFAGVLHASAPVDSADQLAADLLSLDEPGLRIHVESGAIEAPSNRPLVVFNVTAAERVGIVRELSATLAGLGVSIVELSTDVDPAPMGGGELFQAFVSAECPPDCDAETVTAALEQLGDDITVDLEAFGEWVSGSDGD